MYRLLAAGAFGNTNRFWLSLADWLPHRATGPGLFGVRSVVASNDPRARLDVAADAVVDYVQATFRPGEYQISPMVDHWRTAAFTVVEVDGRFVVEGRLQPAASEKWRGMFLAPDRWDGTAGRMVLKAALNENSYDDLLAVLDRYPGHVVELTALDREYGTIAGRNTIVWEVRGGY